jgi:hypothetical protein
MKNVRNDLNTDPEQEAVYYLIKVVPSGTIKKAVSTVGIADIFGIENAHREEIKSLTN